jgi:hypothetical protein
VLCWHGSWRHLVLAAVLLGGGEAVAQDVLDRVVARVGGVAITLSDARAAIGLGLVDVPAGADAVALATVQLVDRELVLAEVARFPPPEPLPSVVVTESDSMRARAGENLAALVRATGFDEARIIQAARDTARIDAYLVQRFGTNLPVSEDDVALYYRDHPDEFLRDGEVVPFEEAEPTARVGASETRRHELIDEWVDDLRSRAEITLLTRSTED